MTSPELLLTALERHKDNLEYIHINSINSRGSWDKHNDDGFHSDDDSIEDGYDPTDDEIIGLYEASRDQRCKDIKEEYIQPIDLHEFIALKIVSVHATDLLGAMNKANATAYTALSTVLPPSLEVLTLRYSNYFSDWDPQLQFIYDNVDNDDAPWDTDVWDPQDNLEWHKTYFEHLNQFLLDKLEKFPKLRKINIYLDKEWPKPGGNILQMGDNLDVIIQIKDFKVEGWKPW
jgi:hypothetical protein